MKKSIITVCLFSFLALFSNTILAQEADVVKPEKIVISAIKTIKADKKLSKIDKERFIKRLTDLSEKKAKEGDNEYFKKEYSRIASSYTRITQKSFPALKTIKEEDIQVK